MEITFIPTRILKYFSVEFTRQYSINILLSNLLILAVFIVFKNNLINFLGTIPHFCLLDRLTGIECPVCGTTRAFCELLKGNIENAFALNASSVFVFTYFIFQVPLQLFFLVTNVNSALIKRISKILSNSLILIIILNWIINLFINH